MSYAHRLLVLEQTERTLITAFLINDKSVQFCRCLCTSSAGLAYETSCAVPIHRESGCGHAEGLYQLHAFFTAGNLG